MQIVDSDQPMTGSLNIIDDLKELFVDDDKKRDKITPKCNRFWGEIKYWFEKELFSYAEAKEFGEVHGYSEYAVTQWLNMLWKYGKLRKFAQDVWTGHKKGTTTGGKYWGVHYKLL